MADEKPDVVKNPTFSWRNFTKPTPRNLLGLAAAMRRFVTLIAGTTIVMELNMWVPLGVLGAGFFLDELKNFFAAAVSDERTETSTTDFPSGNQVTMTRNIEQEPPPEKK